LGLGKGLRIKEKEMGISGSPVQRQQEKRSETSEIDVLKLGDRLITRFQLLMKLFQLYGSKNVPLHNFIQECIQNINILVEREKSLSLKIVTNDFFLNGQRLRYSIEGFASYKNLLVQWKKRFIGGVIFRGSVNETILREFIYALLSLEEGNEDNAYIFTGKLVENGISSIEVEPLELFEDEGKSKREGRGGAKEGTKGGAKEGGYSPHGADPKGAAKKVFFEAIAAIREFMKSASEDRYPNARRLKRVAQRAVYLILEDESFLLGLASIKNYDEYTFNHSVNVAIYALAIGNRLGFSKNTLKELGLTALLHDIGKSKISKQILNKPGSLADEEWEVMKTHPLKGVEIILNLKHMGEIDPKMVFGIFEHHQKNNLLGYPELILKKERNFFGQIIQIADVYDALSTPRVYKKAYTPEQALAMMVKDKGSHFDLTLLKILIGLIGIYPVGSLVLLNTQDLGVVYKSNAQSPDRPRTNLLARDEAGYPKKEMIDLTETDEQGQYKASIVKTLDPLKYHIDICKYFI
jgi:HD-GYP domain-containing protein (c-di-GMP phosphodiesterase class II)